MTAPEYADELVRALADRVLAASGPVNEALIREAALPLFRRVMEDCAGCADEVGGTGPTAHLIAVDIRKMKGQ